MNKKEQDSDSLKESFPPSIEVETRAVIPARELDSILANLIELGGEQISIEKIEDSHYCPQQVTSFDEIAMNEVGSYGLRVRRVTTQTGSESNINAKVLTRPNDHSSWKEVETNVESLEAISEILEIVGFKKFFSLTKDRQTYHVDNFTVVIDDIPDFGIVIEAEQLVTESKVDQAKKDTKDLLYKIGITEEQLLTTSVPRLLMQQFAQF